MLQSGYLDQPYCVQSPLPNGTVVWTCVITAGPDHEGGPDEHMVSVLSFDKGPITTKMKKEERKKEAGGEEKKEEEGGGGRLKKKKKR